VAAYNIYWCNGRYCCFSDPDNKEIDYKKIKHGPLSKSISLADFLNNVEMFTHFPGIRRKVRV
jgi:hypothetical protein